MTAMNIAEVTSQVPAECHRGVDEGFWSRLEARAGQLGLTGPVAMMQASEVPGAGS
jgi:hypothetical protein